MKPRWCQTKREEEPDEREWSLNGAKRKAREEPDEQEWKLYIG
jgi:hypothetical protein